jgi:hypothetical protein
MHDATSDLVTANRCMGMTGFACGLKFMPRNAQSKSADTGCFAALLYLESSIRSAAVSGLHCVWLLWLLL